MRHPVSSPWALAIAAVSATLGLHSAAIAQPPPSYYGGYYGGYHASTAAEGAQYGMADRMRAAGERNLANSQAAINAEQARSQNIDNQVQATNAYWEKKNIYKQNTAQAQYELNQKRQENRSRNMLKGVTANELDPTTGAVHWPMICADDKYAEYSKPLTELFAKRGTYGELSTEDYLEAKKLIKDFRAAITADKSLYPQAPLSQSLRFLLKLNRELDANFS